MARNAYLYTRHKKKKELRRQWKTTPHIDQGKGATLVPGTVKILHKFLCICVTHCVCPYTGSARTVRKWYINIYTVFWAGILYNIRSCMVPKHGSGQPNVYTYTHARWPFVLFCLFYSAYFTLPVLLCLSYSACFYSAYFTLPVLLCLFYSACSAYFTLPVLLSLFYSACLTLPVLLCLIYSA